jgi:hypothetical protein
LQKIISGGIFEVPTEEQLRLSGPLEYDFVFWISVSGIPKKLLEG